MMVNDLTSEENISRIQQFGRDEQYDTLMVVFPSGNEVEGPARFDLLPEVRMLTGSQIDHYATIELGLLDTQSGKLFMQVQGHSFATLEKLAGEKLDKDCVEVFLAHREEVEKIQQTFQEDNLG